MSIAHQIEQSRALNVNAPSVSQAARLPASYEHAKQALAECASLDECQDWADKAAALASYAKQAKDDEMMKMAVRIRDRAIRRSGELLKQIDGQGARSDKLTEGDNGKFTQRQAAEAAGMSEHQQLQAVRVANVPEADFTRQVESDHPPTVTALAKQGTKTAPRPVIDLQGRDPGDFNRALHFIAEFEDYSKALSAFDLNSILPSLVNTERLRVRAAIGKIDAIHDRIVTRI